MATPTAGLATSADRSTTPTLNQWGLRLLCYPLFFASGAAGLIYEVVWTRLLLNSFGAGLYAVCAVLAAFMGGLALGSWALGRASDRLERPLALYGALELAVGLAGLAMPAVLGHVGILDRWAYHLWGQNFAMLSGFRFIIALAVMLVPTTLMGATLPVLSRFLVRDDKHLGLHVSALYAINTLGAVCGAFAAGFSLIGWRGLSGTDFIAVGLNVLVGLTALGLSLRCLERRVPTPAPEASLAPAAAAQTAPAYKTGGIIASTSPRNIRWVLLTALFSGAVALAAQVLWSRSLIFSFEYLKSTTYAFTAMLTVFLAGLAIGSALIGAVLDTQREPFRLYGLLLTLIGMAILFSVPMLYYGARLLTFGDPYNETTGRLDWILAVANVILQSIAVLGIPTILMGMAFPVAARVVTKVGQVGTDVGRLYSLNTIGSILGSLLAGFLIVPCFGLTLGLCVLGAVELALGVITLWRAGLSPRQRIAIAVLAVLMLGAVIHGLPRERGLQPRTTQRDTTAFYKEGPLATVAVMENNVKERTIYVDAVGVAGTDAIIQTDQKSLAHVPMMLLPKAQSALTVGFGSGGASYSLLLHDSLRTVHCVEICPTVLEAASSLSPANHLFFGSDPGDNPLSFARKDPRYDIILDDARAYLRYTDRRYDFIATDCTDLRYKSNANLYDKEYFTACRQHLTQDGIVVVWMPLGGLAPEVFKTALRTFHTVFPQMGIFFMDNEPTHYILLIGWQDQIKLDYNLFAQRLHEADVHKDLGELYLDDPVKLLSCFITGGERLSAFLKGGPINTEDFPTLEFESPKYGYQDKPVIDNLNTLMGIHVSPLDFMSTGTLPAKELDRLRRYEAALPWIIKGHNHSRMLQIEEATQCYMKARELAPEDLSVRNLLQFPILQHRIQLDPADAVAYALYGRTLMIQGEKEPERLDEAYDMLTKAEKLLAYGLSQPNPEPDLTARHRLVQEWLTTVKTALEAAQH